MIFQELSLPGVYIIEAEPIRDDRGFFARTFCQQEFKAKGLNPCVAQCNISYSQKAGTLRGMHYQAAPYQEAKLVSCIKGEVYDVILDLRKDSCTFMKWQAVNLSERNRKMLYIPEDFAHGFQTLQDNTELFYQISEYHHPEYARGIRWNDPSFLIDWPQIPNGLISERDMTWGDYTV